MEKKPPLKQQQEAIEDSCVSIYFLTLQDFTENIEELQTPLAEEERVLIFQAVACKLKNTCEVDNSVWEKHVFSPVHTSTPLPFEVCSDVCAGLISLLFSATSYLQNADSSTQARYILN